MNKKWWGLSLVLVCLLFWVSGGTRFFFRSDERLKSTDTKISPDEMKKGFFQIADQAFPGGYKEPLGSGKPSRSPVCEKLENEILRVSVADFLRLLEEGFTKLSQECLSVRGEGTYLEQIGPDCESIKGKLRNSERCMRWIRVYRASLIDEMTAGEADLSRLPFQVLVNKFIWQQTRYGESSLPEQKKLLEEIARIRPDHPSTYKLKATLSLMGTPDYSEMQKAIEEGLLRHPQDRELQELWYYAEAKNAGKNANFQSRNPDYPLARYYRAANLWKLGRREDARRVIEELVRIYPRDGRFSHTLSLIRNGEKEPFNLTLNLEEGGW